MEVNDLRIFQAVVHHGSISKAALELSYVQSNVTARIKLLEKELQTPLFYRHKRGVTLNSEGKKLLEYTRQILSTFEEMQRFFLSTSEPSGILEIGIVETVIALPHLLSSYCSRYPDVDLSLQAGVTNQLVEEVHKGNLDGAFVTGPITHPLLAQHEVIQEELVLVSRKSHFSLDEISKSSLLLYTKGCGYRDKLESWLKSEGILPKRIMEFGTFETIIGGVSAGIGFTVLPKTSVAQLADHASVHCHALPEPFSKITTVFIHRNDTYLTSTMQAFIDLIENLPPQPIHTGGR